MSHEGNQKTFMVHSGETQEQVSGVTTLVPLQDSQNH